MSTLRQEIHDYIDDIPESKLLALKPLLSMITSDMPIVETDLTDEEKDIILEGREEYKKGNYVSLDEIRNIL